MNSQQTPKRPTMAALFDKEKAFYDYVLANSDCLHSVIPPTFDAIPEKGQALPRLRPQRYIRWIGRLRKGHTAKAKELLEHLQQFYRVVTETDDKEPFPHRFARFYDDVEQINLHFHEAIKSWRLKTDGELYKALMPEPELKDWIKMHIVDVQGAGESHINEVTAQMVAAAKRLRAFGIKSRAYQYSRSLLGIVEVCLYCEAKSLYKHFGTDEIQAHKATGTRYNATIRHMGSSRSKRATFGFMLIDENSPITEKDIHISAPRGERPDRMANMGMELAWPNEIIRLDYSIFNKKAKSNNS